MEAAEPLVVYLVRHAERDEDGTNDPPISAEGRARAELLAAMLADAGVDRIHATAFKRTVQTAAPMALSLGLDEVEGYDGGDLAAFSGKLRGAGGRHLVVGHSNTTRTLIEVLGGDPGPAIEEFEHDRLYILTVSEQGVTTVLLRFGAPYR